MHIKTVPSRLLQLDTKTGKYVWNENVGSRVMGNARVRWRAELQI